MCGVRYVLNDPTCNRLQGVRFDQKRRVWFSVWHDVKQKRRKKSFSLKNYSYDVRTLLFCSLLLPPFQIGSNCHSFPSFFHPPSSLQSPLIYAPLGGQRCGHCVAPDPPRRESTRQPPPCQAYVRCTPSLSIFTSPSCFLMHADFHSSCRWRESTTVR